MVRDLVDEVVRAWYERMCEAGGSRYIVKPSSTSAVEDLEDACPNFLEVIDDLPDVDTIVVPVGGGGLLSGVALGAKGVRPGVRVVGVEAASNPVFARSLAAGTITHVDVLPTIADGLSGNLEPGSVTFEMVRDLVDEVVAVSEEFFSHRIEPTQQIMDLGRSPFLHTDGEIAIRHPARRVQ